MSSFLQLERLAKSFGSNRALGGVDLTVGAEELLVVLGPTGAGKTTLLRTIAGLEQADGGIVRMAGTDVSRRSPAERDVALVFQDFSLYAGWTVRRNLEFPLRAPRHELGAEEIDRRVRWAASLLGISALLERPAEQLSGGEMQRVAIGRAIVRRPRLFLLDEPLTNLDAKLRETLRTELALLQRRLRIPMVYVTHDQAEALSMADRVAVLTRGKIRQIGSPEEVYAEPVSPEVARLLGDPPINLLPVRLRDGSWEANGIPVMEASGHTEAEMTLGIRPEDLRPNGGSESARVLLVEESGPNLVLAVEWCGAIVHILAEGNTAALPGDQIYPRIDPMSAVLWAPEERKTIERI